MTDTLVATPDPEPHWGNTTILSGSYIQISSVAPQQWCGQDQPHPMHQWVRQDGFYALCAGHS